MIEVAIFAWMFAMAVIVALLKIIHPDIEWRCLIGKHRFLYPYEKHGMHIDKNGGVVGSKRIVYKCRCGKIKKAESEDWNVAFASHKTERYIVPYGVTLIGSDGVEVRLSNGSVVIASHAT